MIKISKRQQKKNSKVLEYLLKNNYGMAYRELVLSNNSKWRIFKLYGRDDWLKIRYHVLWGIQTRFYKKFPRLFPKSKKTNYIVFPTYLSDSYLNKIITRVAQECTKETIREDISFSTLTLLKILSNSRINYMKVEYYL